MWQSLMFIVCGEALYDIFAETPAAGDGSVKHRAVMGGSPFNVAIGLARLGVKTGFLSGISRDPMGAALVARLHHEGISTRYVIRKAERTARMLVALDDAGIARYIFDGDRTADTSLTHADLPSLGLM
jgi:fructokinase